MNKLLSYSRTIFAIALPIMLQNIVESVFMATDMAFIGYYDPRNGLSAVNNVFQPFFTLLSFFMAITQGVTIVVSQRIGAKRPYTARRFAEVAFFFNVIISLGYLVLWQTLSAPLLGLIGSKGEILSIGVSFLTFFSIQFLTLGLGMTSSALFQAEGKTLPLMIVAISKCLLNIGLSWVLIFGKLGLPALGVEGSAVANSLCAMTGDLILFFLYVRKSSLKPRLRKIFSPVGKLYGHIMRLGLPVGLEYILWSLGQAGLVMMINQIDTKSSGYFGAFNVLIQLSMTVYNGIGVASMVLVGQSTGAKKPREALLAANYAVLFSQMVCVLIMALFILAPRVVLSLFIHDQATIDFMVPYLILFGTSMFVKALNIIAGNSIRGTGNTLWMMWTQLGGTVVIIGSAAIFLFGFKMGFESLLIAVLIDETMRAAVNATKFYLGQGKAVRRRDEELARETALNPGA
jgi:putative MATE family efflux protein